MDVFFKKSWVRVLRTAVVHDLIKYFIDETELFLDIILGDFPITIRLADEDELVEELHRHGCIEVGLGGSQKDEVLVRHSHIADPIQQQNRTVPVLLGCDYL